MNALLDVILPVFLVIGMGYAAARARLFGPEAVDALMRYAQNFAAPTLLFTSIARLDLAATFQPALFLSFYLAAFASFFTAFAAAIPISACESCGVPMSMMSTSGSSIAAR